MNIKEIRDLLMRVRVLLDQDVEDFGPIEASRHKACIDEIDKFLEATKSEV